MNSLSKNGLFSQISKILKSSGPIYDSWGCTEIGFYNEFPFLGHAWSAKCNGFFFQGRIFVAMGTEKGTLSIAREDAFGKTLTRKEFNEMIMLNLPIKKAIDQLDRWIERGNLSDEEYQRMADAEAMKVLHLLSSMKR